MFAILNSGVPIPASSPASAYLFSTVPVMGEVTRVFCNWSSSCAICISSEELRADTCWVLCIRSVCCAASSLSSTSSCDSISSHCFWFAAFASISRSTRCFSLLSVLIRSSREAVCFWISGRCARTPFAFERRASFCRYNCVLSITPTSCPSCSLIPSSTFSSKISPFACEETSISVASNDPVAS